QVKYRDQGILTAEAKTKLLDQTIAASRGQIRCYEGYFPGNASEQRLGHRRLGGRLTAEPLKAQFQDMALTDGLAGASSRRCQVANLAQPLTPPFVADKVNKTIKPRRSRVWQHH